MIAVSEGRGHNVLLMFDENLAHTLHKVCQTDADGINLVCTADFTSRNVQL